MTLFRALLILLSSIYLISCDFEKAAQRHENLPRATGQPSEIFIVMDSAQWEGEVGKYVRGIFSENIPSIPRQQPRFELNHFMPENFQGFLRKHRNIIFLTVIDSDSRGNRILRSNFTNESLNMIEDDSTLFMYAKEDEFARGQNILHLFGKNEGDLLKNLQKNRKSLLNHFEKIEEERIYRGLYSVDYEKGLSSHVEQKLGCSIKVPTGFEIAIEDDQFIWLRSFSPDVDKNIFISYTDYTSEAMFSLDSLLELRTRLSKPYILYKPEDPGSYLLAETENFNIFRKEINFKGKFAVELKGLWKINGYYMGGPFVSYAMVDESTGRFYYIEAFLYSPGQPQRDYMRELETILTTFDVNDNDTEGAST